MTAQRTHRFVALWGAALTAGVLGGSFAADIPPPSPVSDAAPSLPAPPKLEPVAAVAADAPPPDPVARPASIHIPAIDVTSRVHAVGLNPDGSMEVPEFGFAGWYTKGPRPGEVGPAVIVGHVDSYEGPDVFYRLRELRRGNRIVVTRGDGTRGVWEVRSLQQTPKEQLPADRIWNGARRPVLRLVTCGGTFDTETRHYTDNVIVYAVPIKA